MAGNAGGISAWVIPSIGLLIGAGTRAATLGGAAVGGMLADVGTLEGAPGRDHRARR